MVDQSLDVFARPAELRSRDINVAQQQVRRRTTRKANIWRCVAPRKTSVNDARECVFAVVIFFDVEI